MKKMVITTLVVIITISLWWKIFIPETSTKKIRVVPQVLTQHEEETVSHIQTNKFNKKYIVLYGLDENISLHQVTRYTRKILVNLGLSRKELEDNLIHAAWELQKEKNATAVMIFAYRMDDTQRDLYTAGRCTLTPFGDWAKATDRQSNSISNLTPVIDIAKVYFTNTTPMYKIESSVVINTQNTKLYKNEDLNPDEVIALLKKGTKAIIVGSKRLFSMDEFIDIYKIRFAVKGKKTVAGWVLGNNLNETQNTVILPKTSNEQTNTQKQISQKPRTKYSESLLYDKTIANWKIASEEEKLITCEGFILIAISGKYFKVKMAKIENIRDYAKILADSIDATIKNSNEFDYLNVTEALAMAARGLGWI